MSCNLATQRLA